MASSIENLFIEEEYTYKAKLPFPQRPGGVVSEEKSGIRYQINFKGSKALCDLSPFPGLTKTTLEEAKAVWDQLFTKYLKNIESYLFAEDYRSLSLLKEKTQSLAPIEFALFQLWCQLSPHAKKSKDIDKAKSGLKKNDVLSFSSWINFDLKTDENLQEKFTLKVKCSKKEVSVFIEDLKVKQKKLPGRIRKLSIEN